MLKLMLILCHFTFAHSMLHSNETDCAPHETPLSKRKISTTSLNSDQERPQYKKKKLSTKFEDLNSDILRTIGSYLTVKEVTQLRLISKDIGFNLLWGQFWTHKKLCFNTVLSCYSFHPFSEETIKKDRSLIKLSLDVYLNNSHKECEQSGFKHFLMELSKEPQFGFFSFTNALDYQNISSYNLMKNKEPRQWSLILDFYFEDPNETWLEQAIRFSKTQKITSLTLQAASKDTISAVLHKLKLDTLESLDLSDGSYDDSDLVDIFKENTLNTFDVLKYLYLPYGFKETYLKALTSILKKTKIIPFNY